MIKVLQEAITEFSRVTSRHVVIAGGAVRDALIGREPKDLDLFVLGTSADVLKRVGLSEFEPVNSLLEWHRSEPGLVATVRFGGREVQVIATVHTSIATLLDSFDWSVSLFGFDGEVVRHEKAELPTYGSYLRLNRCTFPLSTLRRGYRFSERYGMRLDPSVVRDICSQALTSAEVKA